MNKQRDYELVPDKRGVWWDLALYVPTVGVLAFYGLVMYNNDNQMVGYLLCFMASFFFLMGANRILKTRLMLLPSAPVALSVGRKSVNIKLKNGESVGLVKNVKYFADMAGKSFGLTGMDTGGRKLQFVLHKGQFAEERTFKEVTNSLKAYK